jgi:hypothetical protein
MLRTLYIFGRNEMNKTFLLATICSALVTAANSALAAPTVDYNTSVEAWNVGSGQSNGKFAVTRDTTTVPGFDIELGLRAQQRFVGAITPDGGNSNSYTIPANTTLGLALWNIDYSATAKPNGGTPDLSEILSSQLLLDLLTDSGATGQVSLLNPLNLNVRPSGSLEITNDYVQLANSWNANFAFMLGLNWNNITGQWLYANLSGLYGEDEINVSRNACFHVAGADATCGGRVGAVPLPSSLALLIIGAITLIRRKTGR